MQHSQSQVDRRQFVRRVGSATLCAAVGGGLLIDSELFASDEPTSKPTKPQPWFRISLAQWSLHRALHSKKLEHLDFAKVTREDYGLDAIEYVNSFFKSKAKDAKYLAEMNRRAKDHGVKQLLIMIDGEGRLGDPDEAARARAIERHLPWLDAAKTLGCHSIRVNAASAGEYSEQLALAADGLRRLSEAGEERGLNVIVENHGGLSSSGAWLAAVMKRVDHPRCGTLPDFGNFHMGDGHWYDRYQGVKELMPYAKAVSAKSHAFDEKGRETKTDYRKMLKIVQDAGYRGYNRDRVRRGRQEREGRHSRDEEAPHRNSRRARVITQLRG